MPDDASDNEFVAKDATQDNAVTHKALPTEQHEPKIVETESRRIRSFAVLDLETSNLPDYNFYRVGITEMSIYGFSADELQKPYESRQGEAKELPKQPRILHKLTLLFNPLMRIDLGAERVTGLNNEMLECESSFNGNAHAILEGFLKHLPGPVCLVAHNGYRFDFPIIKHVLDKISQKLPSDLLCLDSFIAIPDIDEMRKNSQLATKITEETVQTHEQIDLTVNQEIDETVRSSGIATHEKPQTPSTQRKLNETTPRQCRTHPYNGRAVRHRFPDSPTTPKHSVSGPVDRKLHFRRSLFSSPCAGKYQRRYIPKNVYRLGDIYQRAFGEAPAVAHHAEADVDVLMKIMQHYRNDFLAYAEEHAVPFDEVPRLGMNS